MYIYLNSNMISMYINDPVSPAMNPADPDKLFRMRFRDLRSSLIFTVVVDKYAFHFSPDS